MSQNTKCPCCGRGSLSLVKCDYSAPIGDGQNLIIPAIEMEVCGECGEQILSLEAVRQIDDAISEYTDRLTPDEIKTVRLRFGIDQGEMSEALGLGGKTFHRWEKGTQFPSRSMGYYLRLLQEFPESFAWLRARGWKGRNRLVNSDVSPLARFPNLADVPGRLNQLMVNRKNCALALYKP